MRISERFQLEKSQFELDFVDIDPDKDTLLYIDPYFLGRRVDAWSLNASHTIRHFFQYFINQIRAGKLTEARELFSYLGEPNETCLGESRGTPKGRGVGEGDADKLFASLMSSKAVRTGLVEHLEDCRVFVKGIDKDKTSDMATNIIRGHLIEYTQAQCRFWGIPLAVASSGWMWKRETTSWESDYQEMLMIDGRRILLVPKAIVSYARRFSARNFYQRNVLDFHRHEHLRLDTVLVQHKKNKKGSVRRIVTKKDVDAYELSIAPEHHKSTDRTLNKEYLADFTERHEQVFRDFKSSVGIGDKSLSNEELTSRSKGEVINYLLDRLAGLDVGIDSATAYHRTVVGILELLFYPNVYNPVVEQKLHDGRKRIDIVFENASTSGFFERLYSQHKQHAPWILAECKNYGGEVGNPELDQLSSRFGPARGRFGFLVIRSVEDFSRLRQRCHDTFADERGMVMPLTDEDLSEMLKGLRDGDEGVVDRLLSNRYRQIVFNE